MNKIRNFFKGKWKHIAAVGVIASLLFMLSPINIAINPPPESISEDAITIGQNQIVLTIGTDVCAVGVADYTCDGVADDVQFQAALDALPATGGKLVALTGDYVFVATVLRAIDDVTIDGMGDSTYFAYDSGTALFDAGPQDGWVFRNFRTDAGGVDVSGTEDYVITNVTVGTTTIGEITRSATLVVAASDSSASCKAQADYVCSGIDDQVEILAALALAKDIKLSEGTFNIAPFTITQGDVYLHGSGRDATILKLQDNSDADAMTLAGRYITLSDFTLDGNRANQASGNGIVPTYVGFSWADIHNLLIHDVKDAAIDCNTATDDVDIYSTVIFDCDKGIDLGAGSGGWNLYGLHIYRCDFAGITMGGGAKWHLISASRIIGAGTGKYGIYISGAIFIQIVGCDIDAWARDGIRIECGTANSRKIMITDCIIEDNSYESLGTYSNIFVNMTGAFGVDELTIADNHLTIWTNEKLSIEIPISGAGRVTNASIQGNQITSAAFAGVSSGSIYDRYSDLFMDVLAVSATHIRSNEDLNEAIPNTFTLDAQPDKPRTLSGHFDTHAQITAYTIVITGVDAKGNTVTETFTEAASPWDFETSNAYATVISIIMTARTGTGAGDTMDIGITDVLGLSNIIYETGDVYKISKNNANATVAGAQIDTDYDTYDMAVIGLGATDDFTIWYRSNLNIIN